MQLIVELSYDVLMVRGRAVCGESRTYGSGTDLCIPFEGCGGRVS